MMTRDSRRTGRTTVLFTMTAITFMAIPMMFALNGCATAKRPNSSHASGLAGGAEKLPYDVALRFSDAFANYVLRVEEKPMWQGTNIPDKYRFDFAVGDAGVKAFTSALGEMFRSVTVLTGKTASVPPGYFLIEPEVDHLLRSYVKRDLHVDCAFRITVTGLNARQLASFTAQGESLKDPLKTNAASTAAAVLTLAFSTLVTEKSDYARVNRDAIDEALNKSLADAARQLWDLRTSFQVEQSFEACRQTVVRAIKDNAISRVGILVFPAALKQEEPAARVLASLRECFPESSGLTWVDDELNTKASSTLGVTQDGKLAAEQITGYSSLTGADACILFRKNGEELTLSVIRGADAVEVAAIVLK